MKVNQHHYLIKALSVSALFFLLGQARADFVLKAECEVGVDGVYLSDVVEAAKGDPIPAIHLDVSPRWGSVREYAADELMKLIQTRAQAVHVRAGAQGNVRVVRRGRALKEAEVLQALKDEVARSPLYAGGELEMIFSREWRSLIIPDGPLELKLVSKLNYRTPQTTMRFQLLDAGVPIGSFSAYVKMALWKDVWVASGSINRGTLLPEAKLERQRMDIIKNRRDLWDGNPSDSRFWFQEEISPGRLIYARSVGMKPVVRRGGLAKAVVTNGSLTVSANVKVLEDGAPGDVVRVQNLVTRKELIGEVVDENTVKIRNL